MAGLGGALERSVMGLLWDASGPLRVRELLAKLNEHADKTPAYNTVQTDALTESDDRGSILARFAEAVPPEDARRLLDALRRRTSDGHGA